jgi:signal transduction histidine kinase/ActR/RegA family two-component response regulator
VKEQVSSPRKWSALEPEVRAALAIRVDRELAKRSIPGALVYFYVSVVVAFSTPYYRDHPSVFSLVLCATLLVGVIRIASALRLPEGTTSKARVIRPIFLASTYAAFAVWGAFCLITVHFYRMEWTAMFVLLITTGLAAGGSSSLAPDYRMGWRCLSLMMVPTICYEVIAHGDQRVAVAAVIVIYFFFLLAQTKGNWQSFWAASIAAEKEKARGEAERSRTALHTRALLQAVPDLILSLDKQGAILDYKPAKGESLQDPKQFLQAQHIDEIMPADVSAKMRGLIDEALKSGALQTWTYQYTGAGEQPSRSFYARISVSGENRVVVVIQDITENVKLETALRESQKMESVGRLAGGVAHDFNNILTIINGYSAMTLRDLSEDDPLRNPLSEILRAGRQAAALTRQLLTFSRKQLVEPKVVSLNHLVNESREMLQRLLGEDIELVTTLSAASWPVMADPGQINQVLLNLAANARDAMPQGGRLAIKIENVMLDRAAAAQRGSRPGPFVLVSTSDNGMGIDPETREHIFEPFFTTKSGGKGTGLGLATVYGIVQQAGGSISVESAPGAGCTFEILLPKTDVAAAGREVFDELPSLAGSGKETILVVEDQPQVRKLTMTILQSRGYHVLEAATAGDALLTAERYDGPIGLMLTDVVMPYMNGVELAQRFQPLRPEVPVLFMSGYSEEAINQGDITKGLNYLAKPFTPDQLSLKVRDVIDGRQTTGRGAD